MTEAITKTITSPNQSQWEEFFFLKYKSSVELLAEEFPEKRTLEIDFKVLDAAYPELSEELLSNPYSAIKASEEAIAQMKRQTAHGQIVAPHVRFNNLPQECTLAVRGIKSEHVNKFIGVSGVITKIARTNPKIHVAVFECKACGRVYKIPQTEQTGKLTEPAHCSCERRNFALKAEESTLLDVQRAEIQEPLEMLRGGEEAKKIMLWIEDDLTNRFIPGDKINITGVLRLLPPKFASAIYDKYVDCNSIQKIDKEFEEFELSEADKKAIHELADDPKVFEKIIKSIAPSIYGHEAIKEAIALQMFGGTPGKRKPDGIAIRPDIHMLLIGDPGCLVGDERVVLGNGSIAKIADLGKEHLQNINVQLLTGQGYKRDNATVFHVYKNQPIIEIVTEAGKSIKGTYNHPLLTVKSRDRVWKRLDEIQVGDRVATVPWIPCTITAPVKTSWSKKRRKYGPKPVSKLPASLTPQLAGLLGYLLGDGWVGSHSIHFLVAEEELDIMPALVSIAETNFGVKPSIRQLKLKKGRTKKMTEVALYDADVAETLSFLKDKRVPDLVLRSGNRVIAEFLAWLFEADGCVFSKGRGSRAIQLKSASIELLRDVQLLLLRFGIHSRIIERNLQIRRTDSIRKFAETIGFRSEKKREKTKKLVADCKLLREQNLRGKQLSEKVVLVRKAGAADVYDVEIPSSHRFIANGVISHNTSKTQLLRYVCNLAPKGLYVSGKAATGVGLTAAAARDEIADGGWTLKAGALVLAAGGIALIDEFDKISDEDRSSLHEAMESQTISIAKAGMVATFKANTSILAAANPKYGRFDAYETAADQFDIPPTLLSRFDLIFPVRDVLDETRDRELAEHILISHFASGMRAARKQMKGIEEIERRVLPLIDPELMRNYIAYARKTVKPTLTRQAMDKIKTFYTSLRRVGEKQKSIPITARYIEAIIRLAEASAKIRLSQTVELEDAGRAIKLVTLSLKETGIDPETGKLDVDVIATGFSRSKMDKTKTIFKIIKSLSEKYGEARYEAVIEQAKDQGVKPEEIEDILSTLRKNGDIYFPRHGHFKPTEEK